MLRSDHRELRNGQAKLGWVVVMVGRACQYLNIDFN